MTVLPDRISSPTRLVGRPASQAAGQPVHAHQAQLAVLDDHEPARVRAGQLAQARGDPVQHGFQITLGGHIGHHVAELAHDPGPLRDVIPGRVVLAGAMTDIDPADHISRAAGQRAGVNAQVKQLAVLTRPAGGE
jgi:hypothetical protein